MKEMRETDGCRPFPPANRLSTPTSGGGSRVPAVEPGGNHNRRSTEASYIHDGCGFNVDGGFGTEPPASTFTLHRFPNKTFRSPPALNPFRAPHLAKSL
ncbi:hypothetical protein Hanom_Chr17g01530171 [Helianthus anomalus]